MKLCECGCGQPAPIANHTRRALGHVKGQPIRFIRGHNGHREDADPVQRGRREAEKRYPIEGLCENGCGRPLLIATTSTATPPTTPRRTSGDSAAAAT